MKSFLQQIEEAFEAVEKTNDIVDDIANQHATIDDELEEASTSAGAGAYLTPNAFSSADDDTVEVLGYKRVKEGINTPPTYKIGEFQRPKSEEEEWNDKFPFADKTWYNSDMRYPSIDMTETPSRTRKEDVPKLSKHRILADIVNEAMETKYEQLIESYRTFKTASGDAKPSSTIKKTITEIAHRLKEIEDSVNYASRFKNEAGVTSSAYGPSTTRALTKISERLIKISERIRTLGE